MSDLYLFLMMFYPAASIQSTERQKYKVCRNVLYGTTSIYSHIYISFIRLVFHSFFCLFFDIYKIKYK